MTTETIETKERSEAQLAQEHGVEPKTVKLIDAIVRRRLEGLTGAVKDLTAEITGEPEAFPASPSEKPEEPQVSDEARQFLEQYVGSRMTTEERVTAYVLLDLALRDTPLADTIKGLLWDRAEFCFEDVDWHERVEREDSPEAVRDIQTMLNIWRQQTGSAEPGKGQPAAEAPAQQPKPKKKYPSDRTIEDAKPCERIVIDWLLKQSYSTKLAAVILNVWLMGDHNTDGLVNDIIGKWTDEILANAVNPPENLSPDEMMLSGVVTELEVWEYNFNAPYDRSHENDETE